MALVEHVLSRPVEWCGKRYEKVAYDLDLLSAEDYLACVAEAGAKTAGVVPVPAADVRVQLAALSRASGLPPDLLRSKAFPARDLARLLTEVGGFFIGSD